MHNLFQKQNRPSNQMHNPDKDDKNQRAITELRESTIHTPQCRNAQWLNIESLA